MLKIRKIAGVLTVMLFGVTSVLVAQTTTTSGQRPNILLILADEGGVSTPLIGHWPTAISDKGALRTQVGHVIAL